MRDCKTAEDFLTAITGCQKVHVEILSGSQARLVLLLDGLDEIAKEDRAKLYSWLKELVEEGVVSQAVLTARLTLEDEINNEFGIQSHHFAPFSGKEQKEFLQQYWRTELPPEKRKQDLIDDYVDRSVAATDKYVVDRQFIGIPLLIRMVATVFMSHLVSYIDNPGQEPHTLGEDVDMNWLYDEFMDIKFEEFVEKYGNERDRPDREHFDLLHAHLGFIELTRKTCPCLAENPQCRKLLGSTYRLWRQVWDPEECLPNGWWIGITSL